MSRQKMPDIGTVLSLEQVRDLAGDRSQLDAATFEYMVKDAARVLFGLADEDL